MLPWPHAACDKEDGWLIASGPAELSELLLAATDLPAGHKVQPLRGHTVPSMLGACENCPVYPR